MTRLNESQVKSLGTRLTDYDAELVRKTGRTLKEIAVKAADISGKKMETRLGRSIVAAVPFTCGHGMIKGFTSAVRDILSHLGARAFMTASADAAGIVEAVEGGAHFVFCADDQRFVALDLAGRRVIDNGLATARGFVEALEFAGGGLYKRAVLVIGGAGQVGWNAVVELRKKGATVSLYDLDAKAIASRDTSGITVEEDLDKALRQHRILFDASPTGGLIGPEHVHPDTIVAAPGIPLGLKPEAVPLVEDRLIHDPLQIGVATMLALCISAGAT
jgi:3-methylornithyl-N6-L-lysine dehydrogenase